MAIGADSATFQIEPYCLSAEALPVVDDWLTWLVTNALPTGSMLAMIRAEFAKLP